MSLCQVWSRFYFLLYSVTLYTNLVFSITDFNYFTNCKFVFDWIVTFTLSQTHEISMQLDGIYLFILFLVFMVISTHMHMLNTCNTT